MEEEYINLRFELEKLDKNQLTQILEKNGYNIGGNQKKLINEIMTKVTHTTVINDLKEMGLL
ncbi:MAG: hypothetical protein MJ203_03970 [archaeon]|nr:hypothetical protein [archaeon]